MSLTTKIGLSLLGVIIIFNCATKSTTYDLPSAGTTAKPGWVGTHKAVRDTIFLVILVPDGLALDMDKSVQKAQSELQTILVTELESILRDYWLENRSGYTDAEQFKLLSDLPITLEQIMTHVDVVDGWEKDDDVSILCALDYEEVADIVMRDMEIDDEIFLSYFMRRMNELTKKYH